MQKKTVLVIPLVAGALVAAVLCRAAGPVIVFRVGSVAPAASPWGKVANYLKKELEEKSKGRVAVQAFLGGSLGNEDTLLNRVKLGSLQGVALTGSGLYQVLPELEAVELPYVFKDAAEARAVMDGYVAPYLERNLPKKGFTTNAVSENGMRHMIGMKHFKTPADFRGVKVASWPSPVHLATWKTLGAAAVATPYTEIFTSLQRKYTDAADNSVVAIQALSLTTRTKYLTFTGHSFQPGVVMLSKPFFDALPKDLQTLVRKMNHDVGTVWLRQLLDKETETTLALMRRIRVNMYTPTPKERAAMEAATRPLRNAALKGKSAAFFRGLIKARDAYRAKKKSP